MSNIVKVSNEVVNNNWFSVKEMCISCGISRQTWVNFKNDPNCKTSFTVKRNLRQGDKNVDYYNEEVLKQFQLWLMRNQASQGKSSEVVKQNTMDNLDIGIAANAVITSGSIEAAEQFAQLLVSRTAAVAKAKQLEAKTKQLEHALEYDQVKNWTPWNVLKKDWKNQFDMLRHKINYTELFIRAGLVENKDYKRKVMGLDNYPTVLVSPEAEDMLFDWLDSHN